MVKTEQSMEEVNSLLFNDEAEQVEQFDYRAQEAKEHKTEPRLLKQKGLSTELEELETVPYHKRPKVQAAIMLALALPVGWFMVTAFSPQEPHNAQLQARPDDPENSLLKKSLVLERQRNQNLTIEKGLRAQKLEVVPVKAKPSAVPKSQPISSPPKPISRASSAPQPIYIPRRVPTPLPSRAIPRPVAYPSAAIVAKPRISPAISKSTSSIKQAGAEPELSPMEQWLAAANAGHYVATQGEDTAYGSEAQPVAYTRADQTDSYPMADAEEANTDQASGYPSAEPNSSSIEQAASYPSARANGSTAERAASYPPTGPDSSTSTRSSRDIPTYEPLTPQGNASMQQPQTTALLPPQQNQTPQSQAHNPVQSIPPNSNRLLDIGSTAEAVLADSIAWTSDGQAQNLNLNYLLRLESGFKNRLGAEILPQGSTLIAQVTGKADSGFFYMEVTQILQPNGIKTPVPQGAVQILAEDGSPLKAGLEKKGRRFLANAASILAPGVERAMDSVANSAESLVLKDGDRSVISTSGKSSNPIASGIAGLANGASKVATEGLEPPKTDTAVPYFKFPGGKTVRVYVNQDVQL